MLEELLFLRAKKVFEKGLGMVEMDDESISRQRNILGQQTALASSFELSPVCRIMDPNTEICIYIVCNCMYTHVCVHMYRYTYICIYIHIHINVNLHTVHSYIHTYLPTYLHTYIHT